VKVFGIDIIKGSVRSRTRRPVYALIQMEDGEIVAEGQVSKFRLMRLLGADEPDILGVDSLQEIAADQKELFTFIQALPPSTHLVQVTGGERTESLGKVAARFNISFNKFDPFAEARTIAQVASLGGGAEVIAFENSSDIVVSRHRSIGKGGWSQNRYVRKIHGAVQQRAREVEAELKNAGLKYEKKESPAFGGMSRAHFHVYASRDMVPVAAFRGSDVQVRISGRKLDRIRFKPLRGRPRHLIVGIDPGTTIGIAAVDLEGNLVHLISSRQMTMSDVIEELFRIGKPLIIASDVHQMPYSVEKIRRAFNAIPYTPRQDRSVEEKWEITSGYAYSNDHERDALSAALDAYRSYKNKFRNIAKRAPAGVDLDELRAGVVRGRSIEQVVAEMTAEAPPEEVAEEEREEPTPRDERLMQLEGMVKRLRGFIDELQGEVKDRDVEIARLGALLESERSEKSLKLKKDVEITKLEAALKNIKQRLRKEEKNRKKLTRQIARLKRFADLQMNSDHIPFKVLEALTRDAVRALEDDLGIGEGDLLYAPRTDGWGMSVVEHLCGSRIRALIVGDTPDERLMAAFQECGVPLLAREGLEVNVRGRTGTVRKAALDAALAAWEEAQAEYARRKKTEMLESIFKEYRSERKKEVKRHG
jgi:predicted RNase H-like nuclease (RuvC/YqgF family)